MDFWLETAKQIPSLGVLAFLVWKFLDHLKGKDKASASIQRETNEVIRDNTKALADLSATLHSRKAGAQDA